MSIDLNKRNAALASPYLNFDPAILRPAGGSQFVVPEGQTEHRGKMEMSFLKIGGSVCVGGLLGAFNGLYMGAKETANVSGSVRRTMMINFIGKQGSKAAQFFGSLTLIYSLNDTIVTNLRGVDDPFNAIPSMALTGMFYSSARGLRPMAKSSLIGVGISLVYLAATNKDLFVRQLPALGMSVQGAISTRNAAAKVYRPII